VPAWKLCNLFRVSSVPARCWPLPRIGTTSETAHMQLAVLL
jgi:hypothetical protein